MEKNKENKQKTVIACAIGECVHVAGVNRFLRLADIAGWRTVFLGPAISPQKVIQAAIEENADLVAVSYRLTPQTGERLLAEFSELADDLRTKGIRFVFGGTPPLAKRAQEIGFFERVFQGGEQPEVILNFLKNQAEGEVEKANFPQTTIERINWKKPYPIIRHHFGLPTIEATQKGIKKIAEAYAVDVISLGIDQDAQENFFHPERQIKRRTGAGGVPVRTPADYRILYEATRCGNFPLMRTYSGTDDFIRLAEVYTNTINIAWCAIPLFWFNQMDARGPWELQGSIQQHQNVIRWYAKRNIPVEINEPHHWSLREAPDVIYVATAYLAAYNARAFGVHDYIAQLMFNSPAEISDAMDLAKMLAVLEMIYELENPDFRIIRQTRTGLLSYPLEINAAKAHLAASVYLQMAVQPHIVHVVAHVEAHREATADDIIEASLIARRSIQNALSGQPDMTKDPKVINRKQELIKEANLTLKSIRSLADTNVKDPLIDPKTLTRAVTTGILDAPQLSNNPYAQGKVMSRMDERGACIAIDPASGNFLTEKERISRLELN